MENGGKESFSLLFQLTWVLHQSSFLTASLLANLVELTSIPHKNTKLQIYENFWGRKVSFVDCVEHKVFVLSACLSSSRKANIHESCSKIAVLTDSRICNFQVFNRKCPKKYFKFSLNNVAEEHENNI